MQTAQEKLSRDLGVLVAMAAEMDDYLREDVLFWRMMQPGMPMLTLGGYLMRQHRLLALRALLADDEVMQLETAVAQFNAALQEKVVRTEEKAHTELGARLRQWHEYLRDADWRRNSLDPNYDTAVETRAMIDALVALLQTAPYQMQPQILAQIAQVDQVLRAMWVAGAFVWPDAWQPAYPQDTYWWLYGRPR
ncbi:MAG: hypothetical protein R3E31_17010 [Chloroflexota bacterium]